MGTLFIPRFLLGLGIIATGEVLGISVVYAGEKKNMCGRLGSTSRQRGEDVELKGMNLLAFHS